MREPAVFDSEVFRNYYLIGFKVVRTGHIVAFEMYEDSSLDSDAVWDFLEKHQIIGFNSRGYDLPILLLALSNATTADLKQVSDAIIRLGMKWWDIERQYELEIPKWLDHIDLIEVCPGKASLKIYNGRLHGKRMQDLPVNPDTDLTDDEIDDVYHYFINDLDSTELVFTSLKKELALRSTMTEEYGTDLRSKSDAQIAEAVIKKRLRQLTGSTPKRPQVKTGTIYRYPIPDFLDYRSRQLRDMLDEVSRSDFIVSRGGKLLMPDVLAKAKLEIGRSIYRMGIGGLHSSEKSVCYKSDDETVIVDRDVTSYYPAIILNLELYPRHLGPKFLAVYRSLVNRRIVAKAEGDKTTADTLKITVNGSFGKLGSPYSVLYSPDLMLRVTVTGQLSQLMLIEELEHEGIPVISANTDGVVSKCPRNKLAAMKDVVEWWEDETGFETEETIYDAIYSRDVNNYIAIGDGKVKTKGAYAESGWQKNPTNRICVDSVIEFLTNGVPVEDTIHECEDIRKFVTIRTVRGGAVKEDDELGKAIRWYYARGVEGTINYITSGNKVPRTDGARPLMELPDQVPRDIDYDWYISEARSILKAVGHRDLDERSRHLFAAVFT